MHFIFVCVYSYINKSNNYFEGLNDAIFIILSMSSNTIPIAIHCLRSIEQTERYFFRESDFLRVADMWNKAETMDHPVSVELTNHFLTKQVY